jgi:threonyl-tRNA synthetase
MADRTAALRTRDNVVHGEIKIDEFIKTIDKERKERSLTSPYASSKGEKDENDSH